MQTVRSWLIPRTRGSRGAYWPASTASRYSRLPTPLRWPGWWPEAEAALGAAPPPEYLDLLRDQDGGEVNGFRFFPTRSAPLLGGHGAVLPGLVAVNLDLREGGGLNDHVVLAEGCVCLRAFHPASGTFHEPIA